MHTVLGIVGLKMSNLALKPVSDESFCPRTLAPPRFTKRKSYVYKAINRERGNSCLPKVKEVVIFYYIFFIFYSFIFIYSTFFLYFLFFLYLLPCQRPSHSRFCYPADRQPLRSRVEFYLLVAGLLNPTALLMKARFFNLPVPIGQDF